MAKTLDIDETLRLIVKDEDAKGRLKLNYFTEEVKEASKSLRKLREEYRKKQSADLYQKIQAKREQLEDMKTKELEVVIARVKKRVEISINDACEVNGKKVYQCDNLDTLLVSKYVMRDLVENYHVTTGDRNAIVEELYVMLNNNTPKVLVRSDIKSFFESILQQPLMNYFEDDARISTFSLKYLRLFLEKYNILVKAANPDAEVGVGLPRGLCFSSVLSEIYLTAFDKIVKYSKGVYFYKRYVDDVILLLSSETNAENVINTIGETLSSMGLRMNEEKTMAMRIDGNMGRSVLFTYLGYKFVVGNSGTELHLSERKYNKYRYLIDQVFMKYERTSHYRTRKADGSKKQDALVVLKHELNVLTGNGSLTQKKHFVKTGVYYTNRLLTSLDELTELDRYLAAKINTLVPPRNLFQYNGEDQYEARLEDWKLLLRRYTFTTGFEKRRECNHEYYTRVLSTLKKLYNKVDE